MDKKLSDKLLASPSTCTGSLSPATLQCNGSATGNPRNKCALKPGHSLMDWIRLGNSGVDLSGTGGCLIPVSKEDLVKHNTRNDAWMAIRGVVYNVTQYMDFHPGGVGELMRGVGSDATKLFNETHAWVNYSQLLNKCRIGPLINNAKLGAGIEKSPTLPNNNPFAQPPVRMQQADILPRLDWIQKRDNLTLYFYTKQFCNPSLLMRNLCREDYGIEIWVLTGLYVHKFDFELQGRIKWPPQNVRISTESGKIEIVLSKHDCFQNLWSDLGKYKSCKMLFTDVEPDTLWEYQVFSNHKFNHDSFVMLLKNENIIYIPPVGYHLMIQDLVNDKKINRCYTPVPKHYAPSYLNIEMDITHLCFLIKHFPNEYSFPQHLCNLERDGTIEISLPKGNLNLSTLAAHRRFCFLAAGSGLTPFLGLIDHLLNRNVNRVEVATLLYFNKTMKDIWCNEILTNMSSKDERFDFINILSSADDSWLGLRGRVSSELLFPIVNRSIIYIAACGPCNFINSVENILKELNFPKENLYIF